MGMNVYNKPVFTTPQVMNTNLTSPALQLLDMYGYAIQIEFTGTPTGTFKLQASCDPIQRGVPKPPQPVNWTDITTSPYAVTAGGNYIWNVFDVMYNWVRLVYTDTSGGTSTAILSMSVFNGKGV